MWWRGRPCTAWGWDRTRVRGPTPGAWTRMRAPQSLMAPSADAVIDQIVAASPGTGRYAAAQDRESAFEKLTAAASAADAAAARERGDADETDEADHAQRQHEGAAFEQAGR